jgi:transposase
MVMPLINDEKTLAAAGAGTEEGRGPTIVSAPAAASPELLDRPRRRTFTAQDKLRILGEVELVAGVPGGIGAIMRREGLYSSALSDWRRQRDAGAFEALSPAKRGPKVAEPNPLAAELAQSLRDNSRLKQRLERAEAIVEIQKNQRGTKPPVGIETVALSCLRKGAAVSFLVAIDPVKKHGPWVVANLRVATSSGDPV